MRRRTCAWLLAASLSACTATKAPVPDTPPSPARYEPGLAARLERVLATRNDGDRARAVELAAEAVEVGLRELDQESDLAEVNALSSVGEFLRGQGDLAKARLALQRAVELMEAKLPAEDTGLQRARLGLAVTLAMLGEMRPALALQQLSCGILARTLPEDDRRLASARSDLAFTHFSLGELELARGLQQRVLETLPPGLPADDPLLMRAQDNLSATLLESGDLPATRALLQPVLDARRERLGPDHPRLIGPAVNLAFALHGLGELREARSVAEPALELAMRSLPADHDTRVSAQITLSTILHDLGDLALARAHAEEIVATLTPRVSPSNSRLRVARSNLARTLSESGDLDAARQLQVEALEIERRLFPEGHSSVQEARLNLAATLRSLGDLSGARDLEERILDTSAGTLAEDDPTLVMARMNLALTLQEQGDLPGSRALLEQTLETCSRTLPDDHRLLQLSRANLANTLSLMGDVDGARELYERVLEIDLATLPRGHPRLQRARANLAANLAERGDARAARAQYEAMLDDWWLPAGHRDVLRTRSSLARTLLETDESEEALRTMEEVLSALSRCLPEGHPELQEARRHLAVALAAHAESTGDPEGARKRAAALLADMCRGLSLAVREAILAGPPREAEERAARLARFVDDVLSLALGDGLPSPITGLETEAFVLSEVSRGAAEASAALAHQAARAPDHASKRAELREAAAELARLVRSGAASAEFREASLRRDRAERELAEIARTVPGGALSAHEFGLELLTNRLEPDQAIVAFRRYVAHALPGSRAPTTPDGDGRRFSVRMCAFVVRRDSITPALVPLGAADSIAAAVQEWRRTVEGGSEPSRGVIVPDPKGPVTPGSETELLARVWAPLTSHLAEARRVIVVPDDVLHLIPLDALLANGIRADGSPIESIELRTTLGDLLRERPTASRGGALLALGGPDFDAIRLESARPVRTIRHVAGGAPADLLRGTPGELGFVPLPHAIAEAFEVAALHEASLGGTEPTRRLTGGEATRTALEEGAAGTRWLHIATHGWFARESIPSWSDPEPLDSLSGLGRRLAGVQQVLGYRPMLLAGLALAGANRREVGALGNEGLITAEEIATLDLTACELAVLSACETGVGERRAGQGVASLRRALHMAGARSVITSLWKVPDEATKELMLDFYRRLWVERKPKHQALWEAKKRLRDAKDERGNPRYSTRDWAAWVLTGEPE